MEKSNTQQLIKGNTCILYNVIDISQLSTHICSVFQYVKILLFCLFMINEMTVQMTYMVHA